MSNPSKKKGTEWEMRVLRYLADCGFDVRRNPPSGKNDVGDLRVVDRDNDVVVVECKATKSIDLAGGMNELRAEVSNANASYGVCVFKRRSHATERAYVVMELADFAALAYPDGGTMEATNE